VVVPETIPTVPPGPVTTPLAPAAPSTPLPPSIEENGAPFTGDGPSASGSLPNTGLNGLTLRLVVIAIVLIDIGWLLWSMARTRRAPVRRPA